jgi:serine/threonine protein kinase
VIFSPGARFGAYRIVAPLGRGGMGEVYRARDTRLGREVALKVLREDTLETPDRLGRFEQEARAASSLNHPNIVVVYEVGEAEPEGVGKPLRYLAMELIEGESLASRLKGEPIALRSFLDLAAQITDGLACAHESGIVHRDLKPSNILVNAEGRVKILDFGLAKLRAQPERDSESPTGAETPLTSPGVVVGTAAYMSPEQARGDPATAASDQFSIGCVFYEMLTGHPAFAAGSAAETLSAILRDDPSPIEDSNPAVPAPLRWIVERCLAKLPRDRYASTRDLARDFQTLKEHSADRLPRSLPGEPRTRVGSRLLPVTGLVAVALALGVVGTLFFTNLRSNRARSEPEFRRLTFRNGVVSRALFVPRSNSILYTASWNGQPSRSYLTLPDSYGLDRHLEADVQMPLAYSEDGSQVLVLLGTTRPAINARGTLAWWPALGGKARPILEGAGWADWARKSQFLAVVRDTGAERRLEIRSPQGALERTVFRTAGAIAYVRISPDEKWIAFIHHPSRFDDAGEVRAVSVNGLETHAVTPRFERCVGLGWNPSTGEIWFTATRGNIYNTALWAVTLAGKHRPLYFLHEFFSLQDVSEAGVLFVSSSGGTNLFVRASDGVPRDFSWLGSTLVADVSPDGQSVLFLDGGATEKTLGTWVRPLDGGEALRIADGDPGKFSPDGRWVVTSSRPVSGPSQLILVPMGAGPAVQLTNSPAAHSNPSFAGAATILFVRSEAGRSEIWRMQTDGSGSRSLGAAGCDSPAADPSGTWFLCRGGPDGKALLLYPMTGGAGRKLHELGAGPVFIYARWNVSGNRIFAVTSDRRLLTLDSSTGALLRSEEVPLREGSGSLLSAALTPDAGIQAYSISHFSSRLYLSRGF